MGNQHCIEEGICSATAKILQYSNEQNHLMLKEQAVQLLGLAWDKESMNSG